MILLSVVIIPMICQKNNLSLFELVSLYIPTNTHIVEEKIRNRKKRDWLIVTNSIREKRETTS